MTDVLLIEVVDGVATVTLNRPDARNALNRELRRALRAGIDQLDADPSVQAIVLTGADPAFCAGLDLKELASTSGEALVDSKATGAGDEPTGPFASPRTPVIGAVNGVAITGGFELALGCDLLVASERARFADTHARVGIQPGWGLTVLLPEAVGLRRARELSFTGNFLDAQTALAWGLVNHVVPHDELLPFARQLAADIVSNDADAVGRIRRTYAEGSLTNGADAWRIEARAAAEWQSTQFDRSALEARRQAVTARGRSQS